MEAEKGTPKLRRTRSEVSPNTVLPRFAEVISEASPNSLRSFADASPDSAPILRRSHLRSFADASPDSAPILRRSHLRSFADASPKSPPKLRRTQLRYFAEVTSEASPKFSSRHFIVPWIIYMYTYMDRKRVRIRSSPRRL